MRTHWNSDPTVVPGPVKKQRNSWSIRVCPEISWEIYYRGLGKGAEEIRETLLYQRPDSDVSVNAGEVLVPNSSRASPLMKVLDAVCGRSGRGFRL